jgi:hypothetical protein
MLIEIEYQLIFWVGTNEAVKEDFFSSHLQFLNYQKS